MPVAESVEKETGRVEAFSDAVFAIAITLLVLEFKVPHLPPGAGGRDLFLALLKLWPSMIAFLGSFIAILIMWSNHHGVFRLIHRTDSPFLFANGFLLLMVTFVPFPTAVLAEYLGTPGERVAAAFYIGTFVVTSIAFNVFWATTTKRRLLRHDVPDAVVVRIRNAYRFGLIVYTASALLALWNASAGLAACLSLWLYWSVLEYRDE
ncbi:MAG TPA: TMEM175 family protein [Candidatus Eisenbacteria bacterium]|nr:TMEM175 family protein [Candidatus Eisenbacteria bacterium]